MTRKTKGGVGMKSGSICTAMAFMLVIGSLALPASETEDSSVQMFAVKVLHVYVCEGYSEVQEVLKIAGASAFFDVTEVNLANFNVGNPADLSQYDVVTFGLSDCYDVGLDIARISELRSYVESGGGVVWTHDTLEWPQYYGPDAELPAGMVYTGPTTLRLMYEAEVVIDHEVLHVPFEIGNVGDVIPIQETHENGGEVTTADVVLKFSKMNGGAKNHYLTTHEWMSGRVVVDEIGHKIFDCNHKFLGWPSVTESRIFTNALCWAGKCAFLRADAGPDQVVSEGVQVYFDGTGSVGAAEYKWDMNNHLDSDLDGGFTNDVDAIGSTPTHTYGDDGVYTVTLNVTDENGRWDTDTMNVTVQNVAPIVDSLPTVTIDEGQTLSFTGHATDPGSDDLTFIWTWAYRGACDKTTTYLNDPPNIDPYPSPDVNPADVAETASCQYGDDGVYIVTLTVIDDDGGRTTVTTTPTVNNVAPTVVDIEAHVYVNFTLRISGEKWHDVRLYIYDDNVEIGYGAVVRYPGNPDEQTLILEMVKCDVTRTVTARVLYTPDDDPVNGQPNGATPAWLTVVFEDSGEVSFKHTFNVRHEDTWTWVIDDFSPYFLGHNITFMATTSDPGSDDLTFSWDWGDGNITENTYYNDGVGPDPYPSPEVNSIAVTDIARHAYASAGTYAVTLTVTDDDGGISSYTFNLTF